MVRFRVESNGIKSAITRVYLQDKEHQTIQDYKSEVKFDENLYYYIKPEERIVGIYGSTYNSYHGKALKKLGFILNTPHPPKRSFP